MTRQNNHHVGSKTCSQAMPVFCWQKGLPNVGLIVKAAHDSSDLTLPLSIDKPTRALKRLNGIQGNHSSRNKLELSLGTGRML